MLPKVANINLSKDVKDLYTENFKVFKKKTERNILDDAKNHVPDQQILEITIMKVARSQQTESNYHQDSDVIIHRIEVKQSKNSYRTTIDKISG